jgi:hypothetical protein
MFGLSYREFDVAGRPFIFPTTTPVQFEPDAMQASIERLLALQPEAMYLTHYSRIGDVPTHGATLLRLLAAMVAIGEAEATPDDARHGRIKGRLTGLLRDELRQHGCTLPEAEMLALLETDLELNAQGLEVWLDTRRKH